MSMVIENKWPILAGPITLFDGEVGTLNQWQLKLFFVSSEDTVDFESAHPIENAQYKTLYKTHQAYFKCICFQLSLELDAYAFNYQLAGRSFSIRIPSYNEPCQIDFTSCCNVQYLEERNKMEHPDYFVETYHSLNAQNTPPHVFVFGGDQDYFDDVFNVPSLKKWTALLQREKTKQEAYVHPFTPEMKQEVENYFFKTYCDRFNPDNPFGEIFTKIPTAMSWDDHDVFDGFGSYRPELQNSAVFQGIIAIGKKYYELFQMGMEPGSMSQSHRIYMLGKTAIALPDTRSKRTLNTILPEEDWQALFDEITALKDRFERLVLVLPIPLIYANYTLLEKGIETLGGSREKLLDIFHNAKLQAQLNNTFGEVELQDDLRDHWSCPTHEQERNALIERIFTVRQMGKAVIVASGDVHHGCLTELHDKRCLPKENDPYLTVVVTASPFVNEISPIAWIVPALFKSEEFSNQAVSKICEIDKVPSDGKHRYVVKTHNFVRFIEEQKGMKCLWYAAAKKANEQGLKLKTYQTFVPFYRPLLPTRKKRRCVIQ